jgi:oxygen-dependent protoporphyrinogen oxidase
LAADGHDVACVEPHRPGGLICSERRDGFLCETGPQALLDGPAETRALIAHAGVGHRALAPQPSAKRRLLYVRGRLSPLPSSPPSLMRSSLLSLRGKLRLLREPFIKTPAGEDDESVFAFAARRFGEEAARAFLGPAVIGIYASDAATLSMASAFPRIAALEQSHGSVLRGAIAMRSGGAGQPISFPEGLQELPAALAAKLGPRIIKARAVAVRRAADGWRVDLADGPIREVSGDAVVIAATGEASATLLAPLAPAAAAALRSVPAAPAAVVCLGFLGGAAALGMDLEAYGFIAARGEGVPLLGCQYESSVFAARTPAGGVLLRAIVGGAFDPGVVDRPDDAIVAQVLADLRRVTGLRRDPTFTAVWRHRAAFPQYQPGHRRKVAAADEALASLPRLFLLGHTLRGVGLNPSIAAAAALAARLRPDQA